VLDAFLAVERPEDAARRLGISLANFYQRKKRALDALGRCVGPEGDTPLAW
jgi:DNA-directed RNA polymerase specialized sigma24 family protein